MSASSSRDAAKIAFRYLCASLFTAFFSFVYEQFSHDVWSVPMIYAFVIPLAGGALPFAIIARQGSRAPSVPACTCWHLGLATFTIGSIFAGVLEIYGTTNRLIAVYPIAGGLLCAAGLVQFLLAKHAKS